MPALLFRHPEWRALRPESRDPDLFCAATGIPRQRSRTRSARETLRGRANSGGYGRRRGQRHQWPSLTMLSGVTKLRSIAPMLMYQHSRSGVLKPGK